MGDELKSLTLADLHALAKQKGIKGISKLNKEDIENHIDDLYAELKDPSQFDWMPKKG